MSTAPYAGTATTLLDGPLAHVTTARVVTSAGAAVATLDVKVGDLTFDQGWSPYAQASLTAADPGILIDPRVGHRLILGLGYINPDGTEDVHDVADLALTSATSDVGDRTLRITAQSDEALVQLSANYLVADLVTTYASVGAALTDLIDRALEPYTPTLNIAWNPAPSGTILTGHTVPIGARWWSYIEALRDVITADLWCDEAREWQVVYSGYETVDPNDPLTIATGDCTTDGYVFAGDVGAGTPAVARIITDSQEDRTFSEFSNAIVVDHQWAGTRVAQHALTATGPYAVGTVGYRVTKIDRTTPIDMLGAAAEATAILRRTMMRGATRTHSCAHSAYWLRPRRSIRTWVDGVMDYEWLTRVSFDLSGSGVMTLTTREPVET